MATQTMLERIVQGPGEIGPSPGFSLSSGSSANVRINAVAADWDQLVSGVPKITLDLVIEKSSDGGVSYDPDPPTNFIGTSRNRDGSFPFVMVSVAATDPAILVRARMIMNTNDRVGLNWETP